jgi:hypothetical protein
MSRSFLVTLSLSDKMKIYLHMLHSPIEYWVCT